jgi:hypothetical protein
MHAGRADPREAAKTRHRLAQKARDEAVERVAARSLGTRALVASIFSEEAALVESTLRHLLKAAGGGDLKSAQALLPWLNQALGNPTERAEITFPTSPDEAQSLSTSQLEALVAEGQAARLVAVPDDAG